MAGGVVAWGELVGGVEAIEQVAFLGRGFEGFVVGGSQTYNCGCACGESHNRSAGTGGDGGCGGGRACNDGSTYLYGSLEEAGGSGLGFGECTGAALEVAAGGGGLLHAEDVAVRGFVVLIDGALEERGVVSRVDDAEIPHLLHGHVVAGGVDVEAAVEGLPRRAALGEDAFLYALVVGGLAVALGIAQKINRLVRLRNGRWGRAWQGGCVFHQHGRGCVKLRERHGRRGIKCRGVLFEKDCCGGVETHSQTPLPR